MTTSRFLHSHITSTSSFLRLTFFWQSLQCSDWLPNGADTFRNNSAVAKNIDRIELRMSNVLEMHHRAKAPRVEMHQRVTTLAAVVGRTHDAPSSPIRSTTIQFAWSWNRNLNWKIGNVKLIFQFNFIQTPINVLTDKITSATENIKAWGSSEKLKLKTWTWYWKTVRVFIGNGS